MIFYRYSFIQIRLYNDCNFKKLFNTESKTSENMICSISNLLLKIIFNSHAWYPFLNDVTADNKKIVNKSY